MTLGGLLGSPSDSHHGLIRKTERNDRARLAETRIDDFAGVGIFQNRHETLNCVAPYPIKP